jgi:hypothetical protein
MVFCHAFAKADRCCWRLLCFSAFVLGYRGHSEKWVVDVHPAATDSRLSIKFKTDKARAVDCFRTYIRGNEMKRDHLIMAAFAVLASASAVYAAPAPGEERGAASSIPALTGIWGRHMLLFELPESGPGPVVTKLKRPDGSPMFSAVGDFTNPILTPRAREVVRKFGDQELSGVAFASPHNQCWPEPTPYILSIEFGLRILQKMDEVVLIYLSDHQVRHVRMNVPHSEHPTPSWQGESVGHYEGDALVVDTIGQKVGPLSMVDRFGTPFSEALHVIERYRLIDGEVARDLQQKHQRNYFSAGSGFRSPYGMGDIDPNTKKPGLQVEITVDDPNVFITPWSGLITYRRVLGGWPEAVCAENTQGSGSSWVVLTPKANEAEF